MSSWHRGYALGFVYKYIDANYFSPELSQFRFYLQENLLRGWELFGVSTLLVAVMFGLVRDLFDVTSELLPTWSCWLQFVCLLVLGLVKRACGRICIFCDATCVLFGAEALTT